MRARAASVAILTFDLTNNQIDAGAFNVTDDTPLQGSQYQFQLSPAFPATSTTTSSTTSSTQTASTTSSTTSVTTSSRGGSGIPEFPVQLGLTLLVTVVIVTSYVFTRRVKIPRL